MLLMYRSPCKSYICIQAKRRLQCIDYRFCKSIQ